MLDNKVNVLADPAEDMEDEAVMEVLLWWEMGVGSISSFPAATLVALSLLLLLLLLSIVKMIMNTNILEACTSEDNR
jgi:succinate-acetate transporter protein